MLRVFDPAPAVQLDSRSVCNSCHRYAEHPTQRAVCSARGHNSRKTPCYSRDSVAEGTLSSMSSVFHTHFQQIVQLVLGFLYY